MRLIAALLATLLALPATAQQISPMTGTTAAPGPGAAPPGAPAAATPPATPAVTPPATPAVTPPGATPARSPRQTFRQRFEAANTTHDGKLTLEQAKAGRLPRVVRNFDAIDTGKKGYVTLTDVQAYERAQRQGRKTQQ